MGWLVAGSLAAITVGFLRALWVSKSMVLSVVPCVLEPTLVSPPCTLGSTCSASPLPMGAELLFLVSHHTGSREAWCCHKTATIYFLALQECVAFPFA